MTVNVWYVYSPLKLSHIFNNEAYVQGSNIFICTACDAQEKPCLDPASKHDYTHPLVRHRKDYVQPITWLNNPSSPSSSVGEDSPNHQRAPTRNFPGRALERKFSAHKAVVTEKLSAMQGDLNKVLGSMGLAVEENSQEEV